MVMEALLYEKLADLKVRCALCSHRCVIPAGKRGICAVRENRGGLLQTLVYGRLIARHIDPIEKKPLYHFLPGSLSYSIATVGCNFRCRFCQNADIAQLPADRGGAIIGDRVKPEQVVEAAEKPVAAASPTPTPSRPSFSSSPWRPPGWRTRRASATCSSPTGT